MHSGEIGPEELLELQRRGLELAVREADGRRAEIDAILFSRPIVLAAERDPNLRDARVEILEELTRTTYPSAMVVAAARHLDDVARARRTRRRGFSFSFHLDRFRNARSFLVVVASAGWLAVFSLLVTGVGESAVGAHFIDGKVFVWGVFAAATAAVAVRVSGGRRHDRSFRPSRSLST